MAEYTTPTSEHHPRIILVTGGAGFIGSNLVRFLLASEPSLTVINLDALTYAGNKDNLSGMSADQEKRHHFVSGNICDAVLVGQLFEHYAIDTVIHLAAESHVDRSIESPLDFVSTNVMGTATMLNAARRAWGKRNDVRFHHVSTDEVYGSLGEHGLFTESTAYDPSSPYSASKAASDHLVRAWHRTYGMPVTISNCSNNYGPFHYPEKLIPLMIVNALAGKSLPVYGDGRQIRDWLYVEDHCRAIMTIVRHGVIGRTYNVGGHNEWANIDIVNLVCDTLQELKPCPSADGYRAQITFVADRPGHDRRYAIDASRLRDELGWVPKETFATGLRKTVQWYLAHQDWVNDLMACHQATSRRGIA